MAEKIKILTFAFSICFPWKTHRKMHIHHGISKMSFIYKVRNMIMLKKSNMSEIYQVHFKAYNFNIII